MTSTSKFEQRLREPLFRSRVDIVLTFEKAGVTATNAITGNRLVLDAGVLPILDLLRRWTSPATLARHFESSPSQAARLLRQLEIAGLVQRREADGSIEPWAAWGPHAAAFHFQTRRERYATTPKRVEAALRRKAVRSPKPSIVHRTNGPRVALPGPTESDTDLTKVLLNRRTWRRFGRAPLAISDLADLLRLTFGVQKWARTHGQGRVALKTSPSGGACHPIEAFVLIRRVQGIRAGFYHYESDRHCLTRIRRGANAETIRECVQAQPWLGQASVLVFLCPFFQRTGWRYPSARAYRSVLIEAGHLGQTFCLVAASRGLAPFTTLAVDDPHVDRQLKLDGVRQGVLYVVGCGTAPRGGWTSGVPFPKDSL